MIYQLKITLKHTSPPIWRKIQLDSKTTFATLHELLQIAFDWQDYHLHAFEVKDAHNQALHIEPAEQKEDDFFSIFYTVEKVDEKKVVLERFLMKEKDKCMYTYDFGDDWLAIYLGNDGLIALQKILNDTDNIQDIFIHQRAILISLSDRNELSNEDYELIKRLGLSFRGKKQWPQFRSFKQGYYPWYIDEQEAKMAITALEQVMDTAIRANKNEEFVPESNGKQWFARIPITKGNLIEWQDTKITPMVVEKITPSKLYVSEFELKLLRKKLNSRFNSIIEFGMFYFTEPVLDEEDHEKKSRPFYPKVIVGADQKSGLILYYKMFGQENIEEQYQIAFLEMVEQLGKIPREVWVEGTESLDVLRPLFEVFSIKTLQVNKLRLIQDIKKNILGFM